MVIVMRPAPRSNAARARAHLALVAACAVIPLLPAACRDRESRVPRTSVDSLTVAGRAEHETQVVLLVTPDSADVERLRARLGADFEVVADDANWYRAQALQLLDSLRIPHRDAPRGRRTFLVDGQPRTFDWSNVARDWFAIVYDGRHLPRVVADIDLPEALAPFTGTAPASRDTTPRTP